MAAIASPFKITYGSQAVGGASGVFQIDGPHSFSKSFEGYSLEFIVVVVGTSLADLDNQSSTLEAAFKLRDQTLKVDLSNILDADGSSLTTYTFGTTILDTKATIAKTGDEETDQGFSRSYAISITGGLPSDDVDGSGNYTGLQTISYSLAYEPSRQKHISIRGTYTATRAQTTAGGDAVDRAAQLARVNYVDATTGADAEATAYFLNFSGDVFELTSETVDESRTNHTCTFHRIYTELLDDQTASTRDATNIRDHDFSMTEVIDQPGDSADNLYRLRRVLINYNCAIDIEQSAVIEDVFQDEVRPHVVQKFKDTFSPQVFGVEARQVDYDRTRQRLSVSMTIVYQKGGADPTVELSISVRLTDTNHHDLTPTHDGNPFSFEVDRGWTDRLKTTTRQMVIVGDEPDLDGPGNPGGPQTSTVGGKGGGGQTGKGSIPGGGGGTILTATTGWVEIHRDREARTVWVGDPDETQFIMTLVDEVVVDQYFESPGGSGGGSFTLSSPRAPRFQR